MCTESIFRAGDASRVMFLKKQYGARNSSSQDRYRKVTLAKSSYERLRDSTVLLSARNALTNIHKNRIEQK